MLPHKKLFHHTLQSNGEKKSKDYRKLVNSETTLLENDSLLNLNVTAERAELLKWFLLGT